MRYRRWLWWLGVGGGSVLAIVLLDQVVMPALVHSRPVLQMPSVVGLPVQQAVQILTEQGLLVHELRYEAHPTIPEGNVIRQVPAAGTQVRKGRRVYLTVSTGGRLVVMPRLVGLSLREGQIRLLSQGLRLGGVSYDYSDSLPEGVILWQSVPAESRVVAGTSVDVVVSSGPRPTVAVPELTTLSLEEAERVLTQLGLRLGTVTPVADATFLPNTVIAQSPPAGELVPPGTLVSVTVAR